MAGWVLVTRGQSRPVLARHGEAVMASPGRGTVSLGTAGLGWAWRSRLDKSGTGVASLVQSGQGGRGPSWRVQAGRG